MVVYFIVKSACILFVGQIFGVIIAAMVVGFFANILVALAALIGLFPSDPDRLDELRTIYVWIIVISGSLGGIIWGCFEIKKEWEKVKI